MSNSSALSGSKRGRPEGGSNSKPIQLLLHTIDNGAIPYLTPILLNKYFPYPQPHLLLGVSVKDCSLEPKYPSAESNKPNGYHFASAPPPETYLDQYPRVAVPSFSLLQDAQQHNQQVAANDTAVQVWTLRGRHALSNQAYRKGAASGNQCIVSLYDEAAPHQSAHRQEQAVRRTNAWLQEAASATSTTATLWAPIVQTTTAGGVQVLNNANVSGYAFIGMNQVKANLSAVQFDESKTLAVLSLTNFEEILDCVEQGLDVIGTNLPTTWARSHYAFVVPLHGHAKKQCGASAGSTNAIMNLSEPQFQLDSSPLVEGCVCFSCQHHSRAYIHHLIRAKELLAQILLFGHNLHHLLLFCEMATKAKRKGLQEFCQACRR